MEGLSSISLNEQRPSWIEAIADTAKSTLLSGLGGLSLDTGNLSSLLQMQMAFQVEMQQVTMLSNIERSKHESRMSAIRNMRVG